jgi:hypothetical protein
MLTFGRKGEERESEGVVVRDISRGESKEIFCFQCLLTLPARHSDGDTIDSEYMKVKC